MGVAAARAFAEPVPPSMGMAKTEAKTVSAAGAIGSGDGGRNTGNEPPRGSRKPSILIRGLCVRKS